MSSQRVIVYAAFGMSMRRSIRTALKKHKISEIRHRTFFCLQLWLTWHTDEFRSGDALPIDSERIFRLCPAHVLPHQQAGA
jgi:hypothetical protein